MSILNRKTQLTLSSGGGLWWRIVALAAFGFVMSNCDMTGFVRNKPDHARLVGVYYPTAETRDLIRNDGHYPSNQTYIDLRGNGTCYLRNIPDWWYGLNNTGKTDSARGTWMAIADEGRWKIKVELNWEKYGQLGDSIDLLKAGESYALALVVGDPDEGRALVYEKNVTSRPTPE